MQVQRSHKACFQIARIVTSERRGHTGCPSMPRVAGDGGSSALMFLHAWTGNAMRGWRRPHRRRPIGNEYFRKLLYRAKTCDGVIHHTRAEADGDTEHFGGNTSE